MGIRGVLFDLDNTLVNREASLAVLASELEAVYSADLEAVDEDVVFEVLRAADGGGYTPRAAVFLQVIEALPWRHRPAPEDLAEFWASTFPRCTQPAAGVYEVLDRLKEEGIRMGIVTNGSETSQHAKVDRVDLRFYMETVVVSEGVGMRKPDLEIFNLALADLGLAAPDVCFVGDHPVNDVDGARRAGLASVWVAGHHPWPADLDPPAFQIGGLEAVIPVLKRMQG